MKQLSKMALLAVCGTVLSGACAQAADTSNNGRQITVSYADLDLSRAAGATVMIHRLEAAASKVCGGVPDVRVLAARSRYSACTKRAMDDAVEDVDQPMISSLYNHTPIEVADLN